MQQQQRKQQQTPGRIQVLIGLAWMIYKATRQDTTAQQTEDTIVKGFEQLNVSEQSIQLFKERLEKARQSAAHSYNEDVYIIGGILIFCGILFQVLTSLGVPDVPSRFAWIAYALTFPGAVGFFLARFLKKQNRISSYGAFHSWLAFLTEIGILATTISIIFHYWNVAGWLFLSWSLAIFVCYHIYRLSIYLMPFFDIFRYIFLKEITLPSE